MGCLGVHFALTEAEVATLEEIDDEQQRVDHIQEVIEEEYFANHPDLLAQSDKAWDAMHRALADGELTWDGETYPLNDVILAGDLLYTGDDYIISLKTPAQVKDITAALAPITESEFRKRYLGINPASYAMELSEDDFGYTWEWFQSVRNLYIRAAAWERVVLNWFTR